MRMLTVVGARPQFIKAAVISRAVSKRRSEIQEVIVHTGQHYDANMSEVFFDELDIPHPHYHLGIGGGTHGQNTGRMLEQLEALMKAEHPDWVLVYGDTDSTLAGALAASKLHIPIAHVEAGLRSYNRRMPEEINRVLTDHMADVLLAPTETAMSNLRGEGMAAHRLHLVGDVMYDASLFYRERARMPDSFARLGLSPFSFTLATVHRAENTDDPVRLMSIFAGLGASGFPVVLPLHPRTRQKLATSSIEPAGNIHLIDPVGYLEMVWLEANCRVVATDSGGVQKEAYFYGRPCVTLRDETEWVELVEEGWNRLAGAEAQRIADAVARAQAPAAASNSLYGTGQAASRIVQILLETSFPGRGKQTVDLP